eukprot:CAMPEP_0181185230 /NCGR_PEP_ID=MMETSP1096-20121128/9394_1 /TAXON_ID=156174 ORGANISM="Chrysochromulina ericina, Strain CCMP281" /NCGR_SAMPLE_ID=MMETSP1096 /ASSEMBLY_ACC=CAM_ASM_000453 /LENGTH=99 /DNA_ID=CAMNT_0023274055 /DNA_START=549 /DNA_END=848 /DNA_ORIENTATION=-
MAQHRGGVRHGPLSAQRLSPYSEVQSGSLSRTTPGASARLRAGGCWSFEPFSIESAREELSSRKAASRGSPAAVDVSCSGGSLTAGGWLAGAETSTTSQ